MMAVDFFYRKCVAFKINGAPGLRVNMLSKKPAPECIDLISRNLCSEYIIDVTDQQFGVQEIAVLPKLLNGRCFIRIKFVADFADDLFNDIFRRY